MSNGLNNSLINNEEEKKYEFAFIENIFQKPTALLKDAKNKIFSCKICTKIPLSLCFFMIAFLFLFVLLGSFYITDILLMKALYKEINDLYFTNYVIDPIINKQLNKTQAFNIRNEILDEIYLESKLSNLQISIEFINENEKYKNQMMVHNTEHNSFNSIMNERQKIYNGNIDSSEDLKSEDDYFIVQSGAGGNVNDYSIFNFNLYSSLTHYLKFFENNLNFEIYGKKYLSIKEYFIYSQDQINEFKTMLTYCYDWDNENGLIETIYKSNNFNQIIKKINEKRYNDILLHSKEEGNFDENDNQGNDYSQYIVRNDFKEKIDELNLLKFKTFNITLYNETYSFLLGLRLDKESMINLFNKQNSNMTTIVPVTDLTSENSNLNQTEFHLIYDSKYFSNFYEYGIKNLIYSTNLKISSQLSDEVNYQNTNTETFFNVLYYYEKNNEYLDVLYNQIWKAEFIVIGQIIKKIVGNDNFPQVSCEKDGKDYDNILCDIDKDLYVSESIIYFGDIINKKDSIFYDLNGTAFYIHQRLHDIGRSTIYYILIQNVFTDLEEKKSNIKIFYYNISVNNLNYHNIEVLNVTTYNSVKEEFIKEMDSIEFIVTIIRVCFSIVFLIISLIRIIKEVFNAINRINAIISLKDMLFNKAEEKYDDENNNEDLTYNDKDKLDSQRSVDSEKENFLNEEDEDDSSSDKENENKKLVYDNGNELDKKKEKQKERWTKRHVYESNFFPQGNKLIIKYTYNRLKKIFENMDSFQSEKFAEKLIFLKRRYKLNEQNEDKEDCELSSDIYEAISKISIINMDDIFYNVYYNQSYALSQSFKMFKSILDSSINKQSIPLRNNKFINFGRILKLIYYFKKEKIQKIIEIIFDQDLKYKQQFINEEGNYNLNRADKRALNEIINLTKNTSSKMDKNKFGPRKSFYNSKDE